MPARRLPSFGQPQSSNGLAPSLGSLRQRASDMRYTRSRPSPRSLLTPSVRIRSRVNMATMRLSTSHEAFSLVAPARVLYYAVAPSEVDVDKAFLRLAPSVCTGSYLCSLLTSSIVHLPDRHLNTAGVRHHFYRILIT